MTVKGEGGVLPLYGLLRKILLSSLSLEPGINDVADTLGVERLATVLDSSLGVLRLEEVERL